MSDQANVNLPSTGVSTTPAEYAEVGFIFPVSDFRQIQVACDAENPLRPDDPRYYDFAALRGSSVTVELSATLNQEPEPGAFHRQILCGHRGSGKSTELVRLAEWANEEGYLSVWMDVYEYFGQTDDLHTADLYLIVAEYLAKTLDKETDLNLPQDRLRQVASWFDQVISERKRSDKTTGRGGIQLSLGKMFEDFKASREASIEYLTTVRQTIRQRFSELADRTRALLDLINAEQKRRGNMKGLLLIFDSMDRYPEKTIEDLLLRSTLLRQMACHTIYTMHIALTYRNRGSAFDHFSAPPVILPMLALRDRNMEWNRTVADSAYNESAVDALLNALKCRIAVESLFENAEDARLLVKMSGGCIRDLLHLINMSRTFSVKSLSDRPTQITREGVQRGIARYRLTMTEGLSEEDHRRLVRMTQEKSSGDNLEEPVQRFLSDRVALRFCQSDLRWTDVHPLVIETEGYQNAARDGSAITPV